ncbi:50S ribosomal protein L21 [Methylocaldum marinum]|uniref:Large ribosomal subunit protein bL21 n=2 Tax=Methylocaldum marinum TaxID=1432792 RepID=A0A250KWJ1_9GAMM|nr:50S ribosomal protein L21 [Methylocaldum marinum]
MLYTVIISRLKEFYALEPKKMYAVIQTGGKQYRVKQGDVVKVETLNADAGQQIEFDKVLMVQTDSGLKVGKPFVDGGKVTATIKAHGRHPKVKIVKFRRRKHYMKQAGHRQNYTEIQITDISA